MIKLPKCFLRLIEIASKDDLRPALTGILYKENEDGTMQAVATDGHYLIQVTGKDETSEPDRIKDSWSGIIPSSLFIYFRKLGRKYLEISKSEKGIQFKTTHQDKEYAVPQLKMREKPIDEKYPNWESVFPAGTPFFSIAVNSQYLKKMAEVITSLSQLQYTHEVILSFYSENMAIVMESPTTSDSTFKVRGLLMPLRSDEVVDRADRNEYLQAWKKKRESNE